MMLYGLIPEIKCKVTWLLCLFDNTMVCNNIVSYTFLSTVVKYSTLLIFHDGRNLRILCTNGLVHYCQYNKYLNLFNFFCNLQGIILTTAVSYVVSTLYQEILISYKCAILTDI